MSAMVILPKEGDVALGGFVTFKLASHLTDGSLPNPPNLDRIIALAQHYGVALDFSRVAEIMQNYGVHLPIAPPQGAY